MKITVPSMIFSMTADLRVLAATVDNDLVFDNFAGFFVNVHFNGAGADLDYDARFRRFLTVRFATDFSARRGDPQLPERANRENPPPEPFRHSTSDQL